MSLTEKTIAFRDRDRTQDIEALRTMLERAEDDTLRELILARLRELGATP